MSEFVEVPTKETFEKLEEIFGDEGIPKAFKLYQNYPNPFNPITRIAFFIPEDEHVSLKVFDILGREITTIVDNNLMVGRHKVEWDASSCISGIYFYRITAGGFVETKKMLLLK